MVRRTQPPGPLCLWQCFHYLTTMAHQPVPRTLFCVFSADVSTAPKEGRIYPCKDILLDVILSSIPQSQHLKDPLVDIGCHRNAFTGSCIGKCNVREARLSSGLLVSTSRSGAQISQAGGGDLNRSIPATRIPQTDTSMVSTPTKAPSV